jgi:hypothetical protein
MNATTNKDLTQAEQLTEILHRLKHLEKGQQAIKSHLWREKPVVAPSKERSDEITKYEAISYINNVVMPDIEAAQAEHEGEIGAQGLTDWLITQLAKPVAEYLKAQALEYIGQALSELKRKAIPYAIQAADWIIDKLENVIVKQYQAASKEQQEQFKEEISKTFPNSRLLGKL